jgi:hypothetical protein
LGCGQKREFWQERKNKFMKSEKINSVIETAIEFADWRDKHDYDCIRHKELRNFVLEVFPSQDLGRWAWILKVESSREDVIQIMYAWAGSPFYETFAATYSPEQQKYIKGDIREIAKLWRRMRSKLENA